MNSIYVDCIHQHSGISRNEAAVTLGSMFHVFRTMIFHWGLFSVTMYRPQYKYSSSLKEGSFSFLQFMRKWIRYPASVIYICLYLFFHNLYILHFFSLILLIKCMLCIVFFLQNISMNFRIDFIAVLIYLISVSLKYFLIP